MAEVACSLCGEKFEFSFYEHWSCGYCSDFGIELRSFSKSELDEVLSFYSSIKNSIEEKSAKHTTVLARTLEDTSNSEASSYIDTLLLFFDSIVVPDLKNEDLAEILGVKKYEAYAEAGVLLTSDNSFVHITSTGLNASAQSLKKYDRPSEWDFEFLDPRLENVTQAPGRSVRLDLRVSIDNLERAYFLKIAAFLKRTKLLQSSRIGKTDQLVIRGEQYLDGDLLTVIPMRFLRNEIFSYINSYDMLTDGYYGLVNAIRGSSYTSVRSQGDFEHRIFAEWCRKKSFPQRELDAFAVLEFKDEYGSLKPLVEELKNSVSNSVSLKSAADLIKLTGSEIDKRISHYNRVFSKSHSVKQMYLSGLLGTLGSLVGGPVGAGIGGVGGSALSQLAFEYDRNITGPITWLADEFVTS